MANDPNWADIFTPVPESNAQPGDGAGSLTRRELRDRERGRGGGDGHRPKRRLGWLWALLTVLVLLAGGAATGWALFEDRIRDVLGWEEVNDYVGDGNGEPVDVVIASGDIGSDIARTLADAGVTMTFDAFYQLLLGLEQQPTFMPGTYGLEKQMSAQAALDALLDPANRKVSTVTIPEGITVDSIFHRLSEATGVPLEEFEALEEDYKSFGLPGKAPSLEGYLFPARYEFDPGTSARDMVQRLVDRMKVALDDAGVASDDRHRVLTIASLVQREARHEEDFFKVSRVVQNRLDKGMMLQFDSTSHYGYRWAHGTEASGSVFTTDDERADGNPYNTYVHKGLPPGPIAAPGEAAIRAATEPAQGNWLYFVAVNLATGETVFTETLSQHNDAVAQLRQWCRASDENRQYCG